jgi:hypothetical protein
MSRLEFSDNYDGDITTPISCGVDDEWDAHEYIRAYEGITVIYSP